MNKTQKPLVLTSDEYVYLSKVERVNRVVGFSPDYLQSDQDSLTKARGTLKEKGIITSSSEIPGIEKDFSDLIPVLYHPQKAMIVVKNTPGKGSQRAIFQKGGNHSLVHLEKDDATHVVIPIRQSEITKLVGDWCSELSPGISELQHFSIQQNQFEQARALAETAQSEDAENVLQAAGIPGKVAIEITKQISTLKMSLSFFSFSIRDDEAVNGSSFALFSGSTSTWFILEDTDPNKVILVSSKDQWERVWPEFLGKFTADIESKFRTIVLSDEMLAAGLRLINSPSLADRLLRLPTELDKQILQESRFNSIINELVELGLCNRSGTNGFPNLEKEFERSLFPLAKFDYIFNTRISYPGYSSEANIYTQSRQTFTAHFKSREKHILEHGKTKDLADYIGSLFKGFGMQSEAKGIPEFTLDYETLIKSIQQKHDPDAIVKILSEAKLPAETAKLLAAGITTEVFRGTIVRSNFSSVSTQEDIKNAEKPLLLVLQSRESSWIFSFPSSKPKEQGRGSYVTRALFMKSLDKFLH